MGTATRLASRDRFVVAIGTVLLAGGLLGLWFPVVLGDYDRYGIQVWCGNGYSGQLRQAAADDSVTARASTPGGAPAIGYADRCRRALAHRRAWAISGAALGVVTLTVAAAGSARRRARAPRFPAAPGGWSEAPDDYWHEAAYLDRRGRPHRKPPAGTTL